MRAGRSEGFLLSERVKTTAGGAGRLLVLKRSSATSRRVWWCGRVGSARVCVRSKRMNDDDVGGSRLMSV